MQNRIHAKPNGFHAVSSGRAAFGAMLMALAMVTLGTMPAHATPLSYHVTFSPGTRPGNTSIDLTFFIDSSDIPTTGVARVTFSSVDAIFTGPGFPGSQLFTYANTETGTQSFFGVAQLTPFSGPIASTGKLLWGASGGVTGQQTGPAVAPGFVARLGFNPIGPEALIRFFGDNPNKGNAQLDHAALDFASLTGGGFTSLPTVVPEPGTATLFGVGLAALGARRRRSAATHSLRQPRPSTSRHPRNPVL